MGLACENAMKTPDTGGMYKTNVRYWAHGLIIAAVGWALFSAFMIFDIIDAHRTFGWNLLPHFIVWAIQIGIIGLAVHAARHEQPRTIIVMEHQSKAEWHLNAISFIIAVNLLAYLWCHGHWAVPATISFVSIYACVVIVRRMIAMKRAAEHLPALEPSDQN